jgi:hypothetical protein
VSDAAIAFANWTEAEARQRVARLLATGWSISTIALMFGVDLEEIDRLIGESDQPVAVRAREAC